MTQTAVKIEHIRAERYRERFLAASLVDGLRGIHDQARVLPVAEQDEIDETLPSETKGKPKFRVVGAARGSKWSVGEPALVVAPHYADPDGTSYQLVLRESSFLAVLHRLELDGLACGLEHFNLHANARHPVRTYACPLCELLNSKERVFRPDDGKMRRNEEFITTEQADLALSLLAASSISVITLSAN